MSSCGVVRRGPPLEALKLESHENSYCMRCAEFFYGKRIEFCTRCGAQIVCFVSDENLLRMTKFGGSELL